MIKIMPEIIHEHHDDSGSTVLLAILIIVIVGAIGFLVWKYVPANQNTQPTDDQTQPGLNVQLNSNY